MHVDTQLALFLENKPGTLARMCEDLAKEGINLRALTVADTVDHAVVRVVVDKPAEAIHLLGGAGVLVVESQVVLVDVENAPGGLAGVASKLGAAGINIEYAYCTASEGEPTGLLVLRTEDPERAMEVLGG